MQNRRHQDVGEVEAAFAVEVWFDVETGAAGPGAAAEASSARPVPVVLSAEEAVLMGRILTSYLGDLRMEIVDTDNPVMKRDLRHEEDAVRALLARLPAT
jgi:hypothetical protein